MDICPWLPNSTRAATEVAAARQRVVEVPYGGSVHGSDAWRRERPRTLLAVAAFNARGHRNFHRQMDLRRALIAQCEAAARRAPGAGARSAGAPSAGAPSASSEPDGGAAAADGAGAGTDAEHGAAALPAAAGCRVVAFGGRYTLANTDDPQGNAMLAATLRSYRTAVFALQPAGDDPARKGLIDAATCGCIPVVFQPQQRALWPWHWGGWVADATVLLPLDAVLNGSLDVPAALAAIPPQRVRQMQRVLRLNAHRLHYARVGAADAAGDALEITLAQLGARLGRGAGVVPPPPRCHRRGRRAHAGG